MFLQLLPASQPVKFNIFCLLFAFRQNNTHKFRPCWRFTYLTLQIPIFIQSTILTKIVTSAFVHSFRANQPTFLSPACSCANNNKFSCERGQNWKRARHRASANFSAIIRSGGYSSERKLFGPGSKRRSEPAHVLASPPDLHTSLSLGARAHSAVAQLEKWSGKRLKRRARSGNQRLLPSRMRSGRIARSDAVKLIYSRLLFTQSLNERIFSIPAHGRSGFRRKVCCQGVTPFDAAAFSDGWCSCVCVAAHETQIMALFAHTRSPAERKSRCHSSACV